MKRLVPENDPLYTDTAEGPDDMPAHIRSAITQTSIGIPIMNGQLDWVLGRAFIYGSTATDRIGDKWWYILLRDDPN